jgi:hypothetical protein
MDNETKQPHTTTSLLALYTTVLHIQRPKTTRTVNIKGNKNPNPKLFVSKTYFVVKSVLTNEMTMAVLSLLQAFCFLKRPPFVEKKVTVRKMPSNYTKKGLMRSLQLQTKFVDFGSLKVTSILNPQTNYRALQLYITHEAQVVTTFLVCKLVPEGIEESQSTQQQQQQQQQLQQLISCKLHWST